MVRGARSERLGFNRRMVAAASAVNRKQNTIHFTTEVDVSIPRAVISNHRERTGERLSLTGYVTACFARTMGEFPQFNVFRKGQRLVFLDDLAISVLVERTMDGESVPEPIVIQNADRKTLREIHTAIRAAQSERPRRLGEATGTAWIRFIPAFLLRTFVRLAARSLRMQQKYGVVGVTAVGMFGGGALWAIPLSSATVTVAVGSIVKRVVLAGGSPEEREHLCLTISFNHDIVDGAPAARFIRSFSERLSSGEALGEALGSGSHS
jgi:pyruvate/2-oxoglutarate dehydrogenase complex dihydrolipoamide acyltransferase (E2) component